VTTEVRIGYSNYKIECPKNEVEQLHQVSSKLDLKFRELSKQLKTFDEKTILVYLALMLEAELAKKNNIKPNNESQEDDIYDAVSENIENISQLIEKLTAKIANY